MKPLTGLHFLTKISHLEAQTVVPWNISKINCEEIDYGQVHEVNIEPENVSLRQFVFFRIIRIIITFLKKLHFLLNI